MTTKTRIAALACALIVATGAVAQVPAYIPSGIMAWFPFTGNAIDSTWHGHDGTVYGCTNAAGRYGTPNSAYYFDGASNYIYIPPGSLSEDQTVDITASLTISAWVKSHDYFHSSQEQIYWRGNSLSAHDPHMLYFNSGDLRVRRDVDPGTTVNEVGTPLAGIDTNFHMFTGTYDSITSYMCIYIDGILKNKAYLPGLQTYPTSTMYNYIGAVDGGTWQFFYGIIDELGIWNRALTPCEVAALYGSVPEIITGHPADDTIFSGGTTTFVVSVVAPAPTYQWQVNTGSGFTNLVNGTPYSGVTTATLTISPADTALSGNQYRCIVSSDSCLNQMSGSGTLTVTHPQVGIATQTAGSIGLTIAPNPSTGEFVLDGHTTPGAVVEITVADIAGRQVHKETMTAGANGNVHRKITLDSKVPNGTYFVRTHAGNATDVLRITIEK